MWFSEHVGHKLVIVVIIDQVLYIPDTSRSDYLLNMVNCNNAKLCNSNIEQQVFMGREKNLIQKDQFPQFGGCPAGHRTVAAIVKFWYKW